MSPGYNPRKAAQVIAYFASKTPNRRLNVVKAVKLVYLADRQSIATFGFPILDEHRVSMPKGPVNSTTYRFINGESEDAGWSEFLRDREDHEVSATNQGMENGWDELSEADIACLEEVWKKFGTMNQWDIVKWTHNENNIPEWEDPDGSSYLIPLGRILKMLNVENAKEHEAILEDCSNINRVFASLKE